MTHDRERAMRFLERLESSVMDAKEMDANSYDLVPFYGMYGVDAFAVMAQVIKSQMAALEQYEKALKSSIELLEPYSGLSDRSLTQLGFVYRNIDKATSILKYALKADTALADTIKRLAEMEKSDE